HRESKNRSHLSTMNPDLFSFSVNSVSSVANLNSLRDFVHFFRIQDLVIALEKLRYRGLVNFHLRVANADGAVTDDAVVLLGFVHDLDAFDAGGRHGIEIDGHAQIGTGGAGRFRQEDSARGSGGDDERAARDGGG